MTPGDWANILVAAATLMLAAATYYMARKTRDEAQAVGQQIEAANREVEATVATMRAAIRPWITAESSVVAVAHDDQGDKTWITLTVHNTGNGLALLDPNALEVLPIERRRTPLDASRRGRAQNPVLTPSDATDVVFLIEHAKGHGVWRHFEDFADQSGGPHSNGEFVISVRATDADGQQGTRAEFHIVAVMDGGDVWGWAVYRIAYFRDGDAGCFAEVEFSSPINATAPLY